MEDIKCKHVMDFIKVNFADSKEKEIPIYFTNTDEISDDLDDQTSK